MSRAAIRSAVTAWFAPPAVAGLSTVHRARPKLVPAADFHLGDGNGSGAVAMVHLPNDVETRKAAGGAHDGEKFNVHDVAVEIEFQSTKPDALDAYDDHDAIMDAFVARIRADRTLGAPGVVWQAGEGGTGIRVELAEPVTAGQVLKINAVVRFEAWEYVAA
jgi:hypothetical protein